jgi:hypothetical protein
LHHHIYLTNNHPTDRHPVLTIPGTSPIKIGDRLDTLPALEAGARERTVDPSQSSGGKAVLRPLQLLWRAGDEGEPDQAQCLPRLRRDPSSGVFLDLETGFDPLGSLG